MSESNDKKLELRPKKKPFKLCFTPKNLIGRSMIQTGRPLVMPCVITPKFYRNDKQQCPEEVLKQKVEYLNIKGPREKYEDPMTENQRYGWYQIQLTDLDRSDRRLCFAKQLNPIVKEHLMNYEKIRF